MTTVTTAAAAPERAGRPAASLYRAVWRWHFYAGLITLPFLILLAVTGGLYLFRAEIDGLIHRDVKRVEARMTGERPPSEIVAQAVKGFPGQAVKYIPPDSATASAEVTIRDAAGTRMVIYVDPYDARVLGQIPDKGTVMWVIRQIHSLAYFGPVANGAIEIAGGWAILLVLTGLYLWWPRKQSGGVVTVRGKPRQRVFWRDLHAVTGLVAGGFILFWRSPACRGRFCAAPRSINGPTAIISATRPGFASPCRCRTNISRMSRRRHGRWSRRSCRNPMPGTGRRSASTPLSRPSTGWA